MDEYIVYVRTNADGIITAINSDAFLTDTDGWVQMDSGAGDRYHHAQGNYLPDGLTDADGIYNYKLADGAAVPRTNAEKQPEFQLFANAAEIVQLKQKLAGTDYIAAKIAEGAATAADYADEIAQRAAWRARINALEGN